MSFVGVLSSPGKTAQAVLTFAGISGIALSFTPFTYSQVPFTDVFLFPSVSTGLWLMVAPCVFLPPAVTIGYATWLAVGRLPKWMVGSGYVLAVLSVCSSVVGLGFEGPYEIELIGMIVLFVVTSASVAWLCMQGIRPGSNVRGLVAMQGAYVVPMAFWVAFALEDFQIGAGLGIVTLSVYLVQIALVARSAWWALAVVSPMAGIIAYMTLTAQFW